MNCYHEPQNGIKFKSLRPQSPRGFCQALRQIDGAKAFGNPLKYGNVHNFFNGSKKKVFFPSFATEGLTDRQVSAVGAMQVFAFFSSSPRGKGALDSAMIVTGVFNERKAKLEAKHFFFAVQ